MAKTKSKKTGASVPAVTKAAELASKQFGALEQEAKVVDINERVRRAMNVRFTDEGGEVEITMGDFHGVIQSRRA